MNAFRRTTKSLLVILTLATGVAGMTGCSASAPERRGSSQSKLLAPHAVFTGPATAETTAALGITEWRIYRGKTEYVVTGYNKAGKAVKGVGLAFKGKTRTSKPALRARVLDGTRFTASHVYGSASTTSNAKLGKLSKTFVSHAVHDMTKLRMGLKTSITRSAVRSGEACSGDMVKIVMNSLQCVQQANSTGSTISKMVKVKDCVAAADSASAAVASCQNAGAEDAASAADKKATPKAPAKTAEKDKDTDKEEADKTETTKKAADKEAETDTDTKAADTKAADTKQDAEQDKEDETKEEADKKQDAEQDKAEDTTATAAGSDKTADTDTNSDTLPDADAQKADAAGGESAEKAGADTTCTSCTGTDASDVKADENTGDVTKAEDTTADDTTALEDTPMESDTGSDTTGDTGGDTGVDI
jgi:hypothetical protein